MVMAGLPAIVSEVLDEATLTFLHRATKVELGPLSIPSVRAYYHSAFMRANRSLDDTLLDRAAEATQGFPYLLQLLGYYLVEYCPEGEPVKPDELESAIDAALYDFDHDVLGAMLRPLRARTDLSGSNVPRRSRFARRRFARTARRLPGACAVLSATPDRCRRYLFACAGRARLYRAASWCLH